MRRYIYMLSYLLLYLYSHYINMTYLILIQDCVVGICLTKQVLDEQLQFIIGSSTYHQEDNKYIVTRAAGDIYTITIVSVQ